MTQLNSANSFCLCSRTKSWIRFLGSATGFLPFPSTMPGLEWLNFSYFLFSRYLASISCLSSAILLSRSSSLSTLSSISPFCLINWLPSPFSSAWSLSAFQFLPPCCYFFTVLRNFHWGLTVEFLIVPARYYHKSDFRTLKSSYLSLEHLQDDHFQKLQHLNPSELCAGW